jgi:integrase
MAVARSEKNEEKKPKARRTGQRKTLIPGKKYKLRVFLGRDAAGKRHYHCETFHGNAGQAEDRMREILRKHRAGEAIRAGADTFGAFLDEWLAAKMISVEESTMVCYRKGVEKHLRPAFGKKMLITVTADDIQRYYNALAADGYKRATIHNIHVVLGMVFKLAVKRKKLAGSPMAGVELPKILDDGESRAMTPEQVSRFLEAASDSPFVTLFHIAFHLGFRPGELLALKWQDFDADKKTLRASHSIVFRRHGDWYLKAPKTVKSKRELPLTDNLVEALKAERRTQLATRMKAGKAWRDQGFIFADSFGEPYPPNDLWRECKRILEAAGIEGKFSPKTGRHTMASLLLAGGINVKGVSERLGHSKITTTLGQYAHVLPGAQTEISAEIERMLSSKK